jgi:hypothetical protein
MEPHKRKQDIFRDFLNLKQSFKFKKCDPSYSKPRPGSELELFEGIPHSRNRYLEKLLGKLRLSDGLGLHP